MNTFLNTINGAISVVGFTSMFIGFVYVGRKFQILDDLKETVEKIKHNVKVIADFLTAKEPTFDGSQLQHYSPLRLTDKGAAFIVSLGFDKIFMENKNEFFAFIDEETPKLKYDVELSAIKSIYFLMDRSFMNPLKQYMYDHPDEKVNRLAPTLGVYIRDYYLAEHPKIN